jgi:hypothetical protein
VPASRARPIHRGALWDAPNFRVVELTDGSFLELEWPSAHPSLASAVRATRESHRQGPCIHDPARHPLKALRAFADGPPATTNELAAGMSSTSPNVALAVCRTAGVEQRALQSRADLDARHHRCPGDSTGQRAITLQVGTRLLQRPSWTAWAPLRTTGSTASSARSPHHCPTRAHGAAGTLT